jgi:hypothetical protein
LDQTESVNARVRSFKEHSRILWAGVGVLAAMFANLFLAIGLYPTRYVNGVVCACGRPGWVTYWTLAIYALAALGAGLVVVGFVWIAYKSRPSPGGARSTERPPEKQPGGGGDV